MDFILWPGITDFRVATNFKSDNLLLWPACELADSRKLDKQVVLPKKAVGSLTNLRLLKRPILESRRLD